MAQYGKGSLYKKGARGELTGRIGSDGSRESGGNWYPKQQAFRHTEHYGGLEHMIEQYRLADERNNEQRRKGYYDPKDPRGVSLAIVTDHNEGRFDPLIWKAPEPEKVIEEIVEKEKPDEPEYMELSEPSDEYKLAQKQVDQYKKDLMSGAFSSYSNNDKKEPEPFSKAKDFSDKYKIDLIADAKKRKAMRGLV